MKRSFLILFLTCILLGCDTRSPEEKIENLNGYWEIKLAELPEGIKKEFRFSEMVDYIQVEENEGFRKKVRPQLGGTFITSEDRENFTVKVENDSINLYYTTPFNSWKETLLSSEENEIKILNQLGIIYTYKRFTPYSTDYGQED
ncbi:lipocalin family protein [Salinimicrobium gaetbulicola]|uniref:Lipocalin family protein n=1 Tax=Salinimicrobium gaetbulicola TaxID=999702 RepID=A0ABW3IEC3_9FLAO